MGIDRRLKNKESEDYKNLKQGIIPSKIQYEFEYNKLMGLGKYAPVRVQMVMWDFKNHNGEKSNMYSKERYKFFLDAPFEISSQCCKVMKKNPVHKYYKETNRHPMTAQMASESRLRTTQWLANGCNGFDLKYPVSNPMAFWTEQDVLLYIYNRKLPICSVYGEVVKDLGDNVEGQMDLSDLSEEFGMFDLGVPALKTTGCNRTGCMFCGYGCHLEKEGDGRFERMKVTHPKTYEWIMKPTEDGGLGYKEVIDWINEHGNLNIRY